MTILTVQNQTLSLTMNTIDTIDTIDALHLDGVLGGVSIFGIFVLSLVLMKTM